MTDENVGLIMDAIVAGMGLARAAGYADVPERTVKGWLARGRAAIEASEDNDAPIPESERPFVDFARRVDTARARAVARNVTIIQEAAPNDWRAAAWWLERAHPDEYGRSTRMEVTGAGGGAVEVHSEHVVLGRVDHAIALDVAADPERLSRLAQALAEAGLLGAQAAIEVQAHGADG